MFKIASHVQITPLAENVQLGISSIKENVWLNVHPEQFLTLTIVESKYVEPVNLHARIVSILQITAHLVLNTIISTLTAVDRPASDTVLQGPLFPMVNVNPVLMDVSSAVHLHLCAVDVPPL